MRQTTTDNDLNPERIPCRLWTVAEVAPSIEEFDLDLPADDERKTHVYLRAVCGEIPRDRTVRPDVEAERADPGAEIEDLWGLAEGARRAALSADEAARYEHRWRVVAPLLMLLALGLLFAAGWSC